MPGKAVHIKRERAGCISLENLQERPFSNLALSKKKGCSPTDKNYYMESKVMLSSICSVPVSSTPSDSFRDSTVGGTVRYTYVSCHNFQWPL